MKDPIVLLTAVRAHESQARPGINPPGLRLQDICTVTSVYLYSVSSLGPFFRWVQEREGALPEALGEVLLVEGKAVRRKSNKATEQQDSMTRALGP